MWHFNVRPRASADDRKFGAIQGQAAAATRSNFKSAEAAQFWYEWRRSGSVLPLTRAALLAIVIVPLSWYLRESGSDSLRILGGDGGDADNSCPRHRKAFSRPDSGYDLFSSSFIAVRPLRNSGLVAENKVPPSAPVFVVARTRLLAIWSRSGRISIPFAMRGVLWQLAAYGISQYADRATRGLENALPMRGQELSHRHRRH